MEVQFNYKIPDDKLGDVLSSISKNAPIIAVVTHDLPLYVSRSIKSIFKACILALNGRVKNYTNNIAI
jgi:hypothetical protein